MFRSTRKLVAPALVALGVAAAVAPSALAVRIADFGDTTAAATRTFAIVAHPGQDPELVRIANAKAGRALSTHAGGTAASSGSAWWSKGRFARPNADGRHTSAIAAPVAGGGRYLGSTFVPFSAAPERAPQAVKAAKAAASCQQLYASTTPACLHR